MNSLIQSLFFSAEFRARLYAWEYDPLIHGKRSERVIPLQLQRLFVNMQLSEKAAVSTKELTESFGWTDGQSFQQQDVNELRLVLFDALEKTFSETTVAKTGTYDPEVDSFVNPFFQGILQRYIRCLSCETRRVPSLEPFFDLQVPIDGGVESVEAALRRLLEPDILTGDNQYFCEVCNAKADAAFGVSIGKLPYFLTLSLPRFAYDFVYDRRTKINSQVTFPFELDMQPYVEEDGLPHRYELYSVCIHSGGPMGGHYYAFVKDFATGKWANLNDANVTPMTEEEVKKGWGQNDGVDETGRKVVGSMANAYMLMYRLIEPTRNVNVVPKEITPPAILAEVEKENETFVQEREAFLIKQDTWVFRVLLVPGGQDTLVDVYKKKTMREATEIVYNTLVAAGQLNGDEVKLEQVRLRDYNTHHNVLGRSWTGQEDDQVMRVKPSLYTYKTIFLEVRKADEPFPEEVDKILIGVIQCDPSNLEGFLDPLPIWVNANANIGAFKQAILAHDAIEMPFDQLRIVQLIDKILLTTRDVSGNDQALLRDLDIVDGMNVWIERFEDPDSPSQVVERFESKRSAIDITFNTDLTSEVVAADAYLEINFDKRKTLRQLKERLSDLLGVPVNKFRLCKSILGKAEYQDQSLTLEDAGLYSGSAVWLKEGTPMSSGLYNFRIFLQVPPPERDVSTSDDEAEAVDLADAEEAAVAAAIASTQAVADPNAPPPPPPPAEHEELQFQFEAICDASESPLVFLSTLLSRFEEKGLQLDLSLLRFRTKTGRTTLGKILTNSKSIREQVVSIRDQMEFVVQRINSPDVFDEETEFLLGLRKWLPNRWRLSKHRKELILPKDTTIEHVREIASREWDIPIDCLQVTKLPIRSDPTTIASLNWEQPGDLVLSRSPWYMRTGDSLVVKDVRKPNRYNLKELTRRETFEEGISIQFYDASHDVETPAHDSA